MSKLVYGYARTADGEIIITQRHVETVRLIFERYLSGDSLGRITAVLLERQIASPNGKERWTVASIDKLLLNAKYIPIVGAKTYCDAQFEKDRRTRSDIDTGKVKAVRYSSSDVLSGLLVCSECGRSYRRVQRASGEIVWRCANRVEHGSKICKTSPTITEAYYLAYLCAALGVAEVEPQAAKGTLGAVYVRSDGTLEAELRQEQTITKIRA
jgi:hypothetical protein